MGKVSKRKYMRSYMDKYRKLYGRYGKGRMGTDLTGYIYEVSPFVKPPEIDEENLEIEDGYCSEFGCARKLSLREGLMGKKCINHSKAESLCAEYR